MTLAFDVGGCSVLVEPSDQGRKPQPVTAHNRHYVWRCQRNAPDQGLQGISGSIRDSQLSTRRHGPVHDGSTTDPFGHCGHVVRQMN